MPDSTPPAGRPLRAVLAAGVAAGVGLFAVAAYTLLIPAANPVDAGDPPAAPGTVGGLALFGTWPADRPDLALVLTGQTNGYLSPCGCSSPQKGGLERRANFIKSLRDKGWPVTGLDLGDVAAHDGVPKQNLLKYAAAMTAMRQMGYAAVGLGESDFASQVYDLLQAYTLQNEGRPPVVLATNLVGAERDMGGRLTKTYPLAEYFPPAKSGDRPTVDACEVVARPGQIPFAVVAVVGPDVAGRVVGRDKALDFTRDAAGKPAAGAAIKAALDTIAAHPARPELKVLLFGGGLDDAKTAAAAFPEFQLVLCQSEDSEPPAFPDPANGNKTQIVRVGHKGQNVGVVGVYKTPAGGFDLRYQMVPLTEDYLTPPGDAAARANKVLQTLEAYTAAVRDDPGLLKQYNAKQIQHAGQVKFPAAGVRYVGSQACQTCHPAEFAKWSASPHAHAYAALETVAKRPANRQFDGECLVCHTVGFQYQTGFKNIATTPTLVNNGCENCHGPGSAHSAKPADPALLAALSPWKTSPGDKLPPAADMAAIGAMKPLDRQAAIGKLPPAQAAVWNAVYAGCATCHNTENDPHFDLGVYWPKVTHSGLAAKPAAAVRAAGK